MVYEYYWWPLWTCSIVFAGMMLLCIFCMLFGMRKFKECLGIRTTREEPSMEELIHEIKTLKEEIKRCKGVR
jgi:hypothetical protein